MKILIRNDNELETLRQELNAAKTRAAAAKVRAEAAKERFGNTDFSIFLELCHNLLSKDLLV